MPLLLAQNIHKSHKTEQAQHIEVLRGIDLTVEAGDQVVLMGRSGAGKSTLLNILGGLTHPDQGTVRVNGEDLFKKNERDLAHFRNRFLGFIFQFHHLLPLFTALENVMMPALIAGFSKKEAKELAMKSLEEVSLADRSRHKPAELSGGEQQRVALARALVLNPKIILADEPTGNLDSENSKKVFDLLLSLNQNHKTTLIVVTHNLDLAASFQTKWHVYDGKILAEPTPSSSSF